MESTNLTKEEFESKYGDVEVVFNSYYKYTFNYVGFLPDGKRVVVGYGGNADDIYRYDVTAGQKQTVENVCGYKGAVYDGNTLIAEFYEY